MNTKEYFLSLLASSFIKQVDIPINFIIDDDIKEYIVKYNWIVNMNTNNDKWVTLIKNGIYRD